MKHADKVFRCDVPCRAVRHGAAADLAEARLERLAATLERRERIREALAACVVEMRRQLWRFAERIARREEERSHLKRVRHAGRIAESDLVGTGVDQSARDRKDAI